LGWSTPFFEANDGTSYLVSKKLNPGKTSTTWQSTTGAVIKHYASKFLLSKDREVQVLKRLGSLKGIPSLVAEGKDFIVISPTGSSFKQFDSSTQLIEFIQLLQKVHEHKIVHRDIRPANLILFEDHIYLIDWGFAVECGETAIYSGAMWCAANEILTSESDQITSIPQHDLIMFLKMYYGIINRGTGEFLSSKFNLSSLEGRKSCAEYWDQLNDFWKDALKLCGDLEYGKLAKKLSDLLPPKLQKQY